MSMTTIPSWVAIEWEKADIFDRETRKTVTVYQFWSKDELCGLATFSESPDMETAFNGVSTQLNAFALENYGLVVEFKPAWLPNTGRRATFENPPYTWTTSVMYTRDTETPQAR